jgi:ABC-type phosphate/phosphonate transport system substrate-binding protein
MSDFIAALPMYDWPEMRAETDVRWAQLRDSLRAKGVDAPDALARWNADLPSIPGGIRDAAGTVLAPDPASLPPDGLDLYALWLHPKLLLAQACWGPLGQGLASHMHVIGQPDYSAFEGGEGASYSSAMVIRSEPRLRSVAPPADGKPILALELLRGKRFAYNSADSMSGILAISRDLEAEGESLSIFSEHIETGGHRASIRAVAEGRADVAAIDCESWAMAKRFEPAAAALTVVGWTGRRKGLPFIAGKGVPEKSRLVLCRVLAELGMTIETGAID